MPNVVFSEGYPACIESHFTVCWWEQQGTDLSYNPNSNYGNITITDL